jgi:nicotinate-nucleotide--dimethylbenzimidazole phosphoribosyltransferase
VKVASEDEVLRLAEAVRPVEDAWRERAWRRLDSLTKPPRSLGRLETLAAKVAAIQRTERPAVAEKAVVLMAADHGVAARGVSAYPPEVTAQMVRNFAEGGAAISQLAGWTGAEVLVVDIGVSADLPPLPGVHSLKLARGTADMTSGPAMSRDLACEAVMTGARIARRIAEGGGTLVATGEMGIGNSTSAAALTAVLCGVPVEAAVGGGTGLDEAGIARKAEVVRQAIEANAPDANDPLGVLAAVGGLEIAGLTGVVLGCAEQGVSIVADGFISGVAALVALRLAAASHDYLFASHRSAEPGHGAVLEALGLDPVLDLDMRLGEGSGAALAMGLIDAACRTMSGMATFAEAGVSDRDDR